MNTNRTNRTIVVIVLIAIVSTLFTACSPTEMQQSVNIAVQAVAYSEDTPASVQALQMSPRIAGCNISSRQLLINAMNGDTNDETGEVDGVTIGSWLDGKMGPNSCVKAAE